MFHIDDGPIAHLRKRLVDAVFVVEGFHRSVTVNEPLSREAQLRERKTIEGWSARVHDAYKRHQGEDRDEGPSLYLSTGRCWIYKVNPIQERRA